MDITRRVVTDLLIGMNELPVTARYTGTSYQPFIDSAYQTTAGSVSTLRLKNKRLLLDMTLHVVVSPTQWHLYPFGDVRLPLDLPEMTLLTVINPETKSQIPLSASWNAAGKYLQIDASILAFTTGLIFSCQDVHVRVNNK